MAEHHELVAEMSTLEQMGTQERQKLAKKRRLQQLKKWGQREKEWIAKEKQLNKRLANMLNEENNGLNLKQYTSYSSSHRSKKKPLLINSKSANNYQQYANGRRSSTTSVPSNDFLSNNNININNNNNSLTNYEDLRLVPNGRVHFNVGVMLLEAAARNDFEEVKRLLMLGVSSDSVNHDGLTALHQCCIDASEPMMNLLLEFGANVDARDTEQWTPLHAACTCGHLNLVKILVENGANLLAVNGDGNMPLDICEDEQTLDYIESQMVKRGITQEMIDYTRASTEMQMIHDLEKQLAEGKDLNIANENGVTLLHVAAANGYLSAVEFLIKNGVNVNVCDNDQWRPLHGAACWGNEQHIKVVESLVEAGAHLNAKTINDETVFDLCDNAELLERLNQLKDELESKQAATGTDRLRRTQSRTNSRVHSVRRTSVRDKNQISRREAREEALLRVENSPNGTTTTATSTTTPAAGTIASYDSVTVGEQHSTVVRKELDTSKSMETTSEKPSNGNLSSSLDEQYLTKKNNINNNDVNVKNNNEIDSYKSVKDVNNHDHVDGGNDNGFCNKNAESKTMLVDNLSTSFEQTNLDDEEALSNFKHHQDLNLKGDVDPSQDPSSLNMNGSRSQNSSNDSLVNKRKNLMKQAHVYSVSSTNLNGSNPKTATTKLATSLLKDNNIKRDSHVRSETLAQDAKTKNGITALSSHLNKSASKLYVNEKASSIAINDSLNDTHTNIAETFRDTSEIQSLVQLGPTNYTLSNLKKQRSDLRMRTTCIGGGSVSAQVTLDPQLSNSNGLHHMRPGSPGVTFRKFRGEPSEVIGDCNQSVQRKCCILI